MNRGLRAGFLIMVVGLGVVLAACVERTPEPTRRPISAANVIASATVKAGGVPGGTPEPGSSAPGAQLFAAQGCNACHQIKGQGGVIGPALDGIGAKGADYIRESIVNPNAVIAQGYQAGLMPANYGQILSPEQLNQLVEYLSELK